MLNQNDDTGSTSSTEDFSWFDGTPELYEKRYKDTYVVFHNDSRRVIEKDE